MQEIVECELSIDSVINNQSENVVIKGKGYYREDNGSVTVYFSSDDIKYKYVYNGQLLIINCNDSCYRFVLNKEDVGEIKNGDYVFKITTYATKIELNKRLFVVEYNLSQDNTIIGVYKSRLSF